MKKLAILFTIILFFGSCYKTVIIKEHTCGTCYDGIQNQNETGIDCGGVCLPCDFVADTVIIFDTIIVIDTVVVIDTVIVIDTVVVSDTIMSITFQPSAEDGKDAIIHSLRNLYTSGTSTFMYVMAWTWDGEPGLMRALFDFNVDQIQPGVEIIDAKLSLYGKPSPPYQHSNLSGSNASWLQRITSSWEEELVDWDNQPTTTTYNQVTLHQSSSPSQDYTDIDVTLLVKDMLDDPENSYGFMIRIKIEEYYRMMAFASSDNEDSSIHPKLVITYIE